MASIPFSNISLQEAFETDQEAVWGENSRANRYFKEYIESEKTGYVNSEQLPEEYIKQVMKDWGYDRTFYMLANTIWHDMDNPSYSPENKKWADKMVGWQDDTYTKNYCLNELSAEQINALATSAVEYYNSLNLYGSNHCIEGDHDYTNKIVIIKDKFFKDQYRTPENQLFLAESGFGCSPTASGQKVFGTALFDGECMMVLRSDIVGIMKEELVPDWAKENMQNLETLQKSNSTNIRNYGWEPENTNIEPQGPEIIL